MHREVLLEEPEVAGATFRSREAEGGRGEEEGEREKGGERKGRRQLLELVLDEFRVKTLVKRSPRTSVSYSWCER